MKFLAIGEETYTIGTYRLPLMQIAKVIGEATYTTHANYKLFMIQMPLTLDSITANWQLHNKNYVSS